MRPTDRESIRTYPSGVSTLVQPAMHSNTDGWGPRTVRWEAVSGRTRPLLCRAILVEVCSTSRPSSSSRSMAMRMYSCTLVDWAIEPPRIVMSAPLR